MKNRRLAVLLWMLVGACAQKTEEKQSGGEPKGAVKPEQAKAAAADKPEATKESDAKGSAGAAAGQAFYEKNCLACHGAGAAGDLGTPALRGVEAETLLAFMGENAGHSGGSFPDATAAVAAELAAYLASVK